MVTGNYDALVQEAAIEHALDDLNYAAGDTDLEVEKLLDDGQRVVLTSMIDGLSRPSISRKLAKQVLAKRLPDGKPAFWVPGMPYEPPTPFVGSIKCMLHPDFDEEHGPAGFNRAFVDAAGLTGFTCNRGDPSKHNVETFVSVYDRDQHMQSKHTRQLKMIEKAQGKRADIEEQTQRQLDREVQAATAAAILAAIGGSAPAAEVGPTLAVVTKATERAFKDPRRVVAVTCEICGKESPTKAGLAAHKRRSKDAAHVEAREER